MPLLSAIDLDPIDDARLPLGYGGRMYGVYPALVADIVDPDGLGRVLVRLPWSPDPGGSVYEAWARMATLFAGPDRGSWFLPDVDDEVLVAFEGGDPRRPFVVGGLWNGRDTPPETMDGAGDNDRKVLCSRSGVKITLDDAGGAERLVLETPGGQRITLGDAGSSIVLEDASGNTVTLDAQGVTVDTPAKFSVSASTVEIAAGSVTVNAGMSTFSGVAKADTVITNAVVSSSYTPGAGNIW